MWLWTRRTLVGVVVETAPSLATMWHWAQLSPPGVWESVVVVHSANVRSTWAPCRFWMSWQLPQALAESDVAPSSRREYETLCGEPGTGSANGPNRLPFEASVSGLLCVPVTDSIEWQK